MATPLARRRAPFFVKQGASEDRPNLLFFSGDLTLPLVMVFWVRSKQAMICAIKLSPNLPNLFWRAPQSDFDQSRSLDARQGEHYA